MAGNRAVRIRAFGSPDVLEVCHQTIPEVQPGTVRVRHMAVGLNYLDVYHREGHYPLPLPTGLGVAGAGFVHAVSEGVTTVTPGDRVAYAGIGPGSYADYRLVDAERLVKLPEDIDFQRAAAALQQGITASFLLTEVTTIGPGDWVLFHAAAGGLGLIACQWAKRLGAKVIGTVGSERKRAHALANGCDHVIDYAAEDVPERVDEITDGAGVKVVYDSVGAATIRSSIASLATRGLLVSFGAASGEPPAIELDDLGKAGSLYMTRPRLVHYTRSREQLIRHCEAYFSQIRTGLNVTIGQTFELHDIAHAHRMMESRRTIGSSIITLG